MSMEQEVGTAYEGDAQDLERVVQQTLRLDLARALDDDREEEPADGKEDVSGARQLGA